MKLGVFILPDACRMVLNNTQNRDVAVSNPEWCPIEEETVLFRWIDRQQDPGLIDKVHLFWSTGTALTVKLSPAFRGDIRTTPQFDRLHGITLNPEGSRDAE